MVLKQALCFSILIKPCTWDSLFIAFILIHEACFISTARNELSLYALYAICMYYLLFCGYQGLTFLGLQIRWRIEVQILISYTFRGIYWRPKGLETLHYFQLDSLVGGDVTYMGQ